MGTQLPPRKKGTAHTHPIFGPRLLKTSLRTEVDLGPGHIVLDGDPAPRDGAQQPPLFGPCLLWPKGCMHQDTTWYGGRPWPSRHCLRWGPSSPPLKGYSPQFSAHVRCGQTAGLTKMPLGIEVGHGPGNFVLVGDPAPPRKKGHSPHTPNLWPMSIVAKRLYGWKSRK